VIGGGLAVGARHSHAGSTPLWTDGNRNAAVATTPWVAVAKNDTSAVVNISTSQTVKPQDSQEGDDQPDAGPLGQFFGNGKGSPGSRRGLRRESLGSGFIARGDGLIVTNDHVVDGASDITVKLSDGRQFKAKLVGRDEKTDLALLKIEAKDLPVLSFGDSDRLQVGEPVAAIGNPFGLEGTVTTGIVSAKGRVLGEGPYDSFIQTDASINPGNSGGPLVNSAGEVIGINTAIYSRTGGSMGIGFAIPVNMAKAILPQLETKGHVTRGWLGVAIQPVTAELAKALHLPNEQGALVAQVQGDSPAAKAGLQPGDVIVGYNGHPVQKTSDLPLLVAETPIGKTVPMQVVREGKTITSNAQIAELAESNPTVAAAPPAKNRFGLAVQPLTPDMAKQLGIKDATGLVVTNVQDGSPAADAGLEAGDVITHVNRRPVHTVGELRQALAGQKPGDATLLLVRRKDATLFVALETPNQKQG
jgi:serine protease Do